MIMNILCFVILQVWKEVRNEALVEGNNSLTIAGKQYKSKYNECKKWIL